VQSTGVAPVVRAFHEGKEKCDTWENVQTIAPGVRVAKPFADFLILRALHATNGWAVAVEDEEIKYYMKWVAHHEGLSLSPEGAATVAGAHRMVNERQLGKKDRVILFNTATGLRYPHLLDADVPVIKPTAQI
jgi:threonine synthase